MNIENDRRNIVDVDDLDLDEFDNLLDDSIPRHHVVEGATCSSLKEQLNDDCVEVVTGNRATRSNAIMVGVQAAPLEIDRDFSLEYSYTTDVR